MVQESVILKINYLHRIVPFRNINNYQNYVLLEKHQHSVHKERKVKQNADILMTIQYCAFWPKLL